MPTPKTQTFDEDDRVRLLLQCAKASTSAGEDLILTDTLRSQGDLKGAALHYRQFEESQRDVLRLTEMLNQFAETPSDLKPIVNTLANGLFMYADVLEALRKSADAAEKRCLAVELSTRYLATEGTAEAERSRAASLTTQARFNEALVALHTARDLFEKAGVMIKVARTCMDLADLLQWLGDYERALQEVDRAVEICERAQLRGGLQAIEDLVEKRRIATEAPYFQGLIAKYQGRYAEAEQSLRKVLPVYQQLGVGEAIEYQLATILTRSGRPDEGLALANKIEPKMRSHGQLRPKLAGLLNAQAEALTRLGCPKEALAKLEAGLRDLEDYVDLDLRWRLEWNYAVALRQALRTDDALVAYRRSIDTVVHLHRAPLGYRLDSTYLSDKLEPFAEAIQLAASAGQARDCAIYMDDIKSRTLRVTLSIPHGGVPAANDPGSTEFERLTQRLDANEYQGIRKGWTREMRQERETLVAERSALLEKLRFSDPRWRNLTEPPKLDLDSLTEKLEERNQAVLSLFFRGKRLCSVLLSRQAERAAFTELSDQVESRLKQYVENLTRLNPNLRMFDASDRLDITAESLVPEETLARAVEAESLIVIPHGVLHLLPWAALTFKDKRLFEYCAVGVLPNLSCALGLSYTPNSSPRIAIVGPPDYTGMKDLVPLEGAEEESEQLQKIFRERGGLVRDPLRGKAASESEFWKLALDPAGAGQILHICCHGGIAADEPMNSGLFLSEGKVDAAEIARTPLPYHEIVLSACSSGWRPTKVAGVELVGDDALGLPGAFLEAGARSVLLSIPPARDKAAAEFVLRYHQSRSSGRSPLHAYRTAQLGMLGQPDYVPAEWTGFTLFGCC